MLLPLVLVAGLSGLVVSAFYAWINPIIEAQAGTRSGRDGAADDLSRGARG